MSKSRPKKKPQQTWSGLDPEEPGPFDPDEGAEEPMEFLRRDRPQPDAEPKPTEGKRCRKRRA